MYNEAKADTQRQFAAAGGFKQAMGCGPEQDYRSAAMGTDNCAGRQSAKAVLRDRASRLRREADGLEALARALPEEMSDMADSALWDLAVRARS